MNDIKTLAPKNASWSLVLKNENFTAWRHDKTGVYALISLIQVSDEHQPLHWEWLISFSIMGVSRVPKEQIQWALEQFGAEGFEEDNHEPGIARKFFMAVDPKYRVPCPCKDEVLIRDGDYEYSVKKDDRTNGREV